MFFLIPLVAAAATTATEILGTTIGAIGIGCAVKGACDSLQAKETIQNVKALKKEEEEALEDETIHLNTEVFDFERMKRYSNPILKKSIEILSQHKNDS